MCAKLFKIMNNSTEVDPWSFIELIKILTWCNKCHNEIQIKMPEKGQCQAHWKKFFYRQNFKRLANIYKGLFGLNTIHSNEPSWSCYHLQNKVPRWYGKLFLLTAWTCCFRSANCPPVLWVHRNIQHKPVANIRFWGTERSAHMTQCVFQMQWKCLCLGERKRTVPQILHLDFVQNPTNQTIRFFHSQSHQTLMTKGRNFSSYGMQNKHLNILIYLLHLQ